ncbi:unnamed protein product [Cylindrotheca closterium]|uniref:Uncharacterized protein n=1 Tax=Cylindrotheca closterium TaxID=2856 RepID=A0AAD2G9V1_9STRA|nr:unnamed protein product [Cylindrotheca closterium]
MENKDHSREDSKENAKKEDSAIPSRCPFSGVAFDPALLKEWENKMKVQMAASEAEVSRLHSLHQNMIKQGKHEIRDEKNDDELVDDKASVLEQKRISTQRIRITNSQSNRTKDLLVEASSSQTVWDSIYDNPSVKEANIRKWNAETVQGVKDGSKEIRLEVFGIVYELAELKELSTEAFFNQSISALAASDSQEDAVLKLQLFCVDL